MAAWRRSLTVTVRASCALAASTVLPIAPPTTAPASAPVAVSQGRLDAARKEASPGAHCRECERRTHNRPDSVSQRTRPIAARRCLLTANRRAAVDSAGGGGAPPD